MVLTQPGVKTKMPVLHCTAGSWNSKVVLTFIPGKFHFGSFNSSFCSFTQKTFSGTGLALDAVKHRQCLTSIYYERNIDKCQVKSVFRVM